MLFIVVTFLVSKPDTSTLSKLSQSENMLVMFVTSLVFKYSMPSILTRLYIVTNQSFVVVGRTFAKEGSNTTLVAFPLKPTESHPGTEVSVFNVKDLPVRT